MPYSVPSPHSNPLAAARVGVHPYMTMRCRHPPKATFGSSWLRTSRRRNASCSRFSVNSFLEYRLGVLSRCWWSGHSGREPP